MNELSFRVIAREKLPAHPYAAILCLLALLAGCSSGVSENQPNGFIEPGAVGRFRHQPLVVNVLDKLNVGIEEPIEEFPNAEDVQAGDLIPAVGDYKIGRNDLLTIGVSDLTGQQGVETLKSARVSESGNVSLPLINQVKLLGLTEADAEKLISGAYRDANLISNAQVTVTVIEARNRTFSILGTVGRPGQYQILNSDFRVLDALVLGGDIALGSEYLYVIRSIEADKGAATQPATAPAAAPPSPDMLEPKLEPGAQANPHSKNFSLAKAKLSPRPMMMMQEAPAPPSTSPATDSEGRSVLLEGKEKVIAPASSQGTAAPEAKTEPAAPSQPEALPGPTATQPMAAPVPLLAPPQPAPTAPESTTAPPLPEVPTPPVEATVPATTEMAATAPSGPVTEPATTEAARVTPEGELPMVEAATTTTATAPFEFNAPQEPTDKRVIRVPLNQLKNGELKYNIVVRPGDMLVIPGPMIGEFYLGGHIGRPGVYSLTGRKITLKQAVVSGGMFDPLAVPERTEIIRRIGPDQEVYAMVNLNRIFAGEDADLYLKPNDVINIGTTAWAPFVAAIRGSFRFTYGFGFLYDKNFADQNQNNRSF